MLVVFIPVSFWGRTVPTEIVCGCPSLSDQTFGQFPNDRPVYHPSALFRMYHSSHVPIPFYMTYAVAKVSLCNLRNDPFTSHCDVRSTPRCHRQPVIRLDVKLLSRQPRIIVWFPIRTVRGLYCLPTSEIPAVRSRKLKCHVSFVFGEVRYEL
jgi:hypothetical protein